MAVTSKLAAEVDVMVDVVVVVVEEDGVTVRVKLPEFALLLASPWYPP